MVAVLLSHIEGGATVIGILLKNFPKQTAALFTLKLHTKVTFCCLFCLTPKTTTVFKTIFAYGKISGQFGRAN